MGELLQAQEKKVDSPLEIVDQLALVQPVQVWAQEEQPRWISPMEVKLQARLLAQENAP